jgi:hypothetical protein
VGWALQTTRKQKPVQLLKQLLVETLIINSSKSILFTLKYTKLEVQMYTNTSEMKHTDAHRWNRNKCSTVSYRTAPYNSPSKDPVLISGIAKFTGVSV